MKNMFTFEINTKGESTGKEYTGVFTYKRPTIGTKRKIIQEEYNLNSEFENAVLEVILINKTIAYLKHVLIDCPEWFKESNYGLDLEDEDPIKIISENIQKFEGLVDDEIIKESEEVIIEQNAEKDISSEKDSV